MARSTKIRNCGAIPERRHDAFLLALLLALVLNVTFFVVQAIMPRLTRLLQMFGPEAALQMDEEEMRPFVLVDSSLLDEDVDDSPPDAESMINREARQVDAHPQLPIDKPFVEEGLEALVTPPDGATGPDEGMIEVVESTPGEDPGQPGEPAERMEEPAPEEPTEQPMEEVADDFPEPVPSEAFPEPVVEPEPVPEPMELLPEPPPEPEPVPERPIEPPVEIPEPEPPPEMPVEPVPDVVEPFIPPPPMEAVQQFDPLPEPPPAEALPAPEPVMEPWVEPAPPEAPQPDPLEDMIDVAPLAVSPDGFFEPPRQYPEAVRQPDPVVPPAYPEWREEPREVYRQPMQPQVPQQPQPYYKQIPEPRIAEPPPGPPRQRRSREGRKPEIKKIGPGSGGGASAPSRTGGAPRMRNTSARVNLLDSDPNMKYLAHKYAEYMQKVAKLLQESLNREVKLQPMGYTRGQAKIFFTIAADGSIGYYDTAYPAEDELIYVRLTSEQTLVNAGPFDPPTREILEDPIFKRMSLIVYLD